MKKNPWAIGLLVLCLLCVAGTVADILSGDTDTMGGALSAVMMAGYGSWWAVLHKRTRNRVLDGPPRGLNAPLPTGTMLLGLLTVMMVGNVLGALVLGNMKKQVYLCHRYCFLRCLPYCCCANIWSATTAIAG